MVLELKEKIKFWPSYLIFVLIYKRYINLIR